MPASNWVKRFGSKRQWRGGYRGDGGRWRDDNNAEAEPSESDTLPYTSEPDQQGELKELSTQDAARSMTATWANRPNYGRPAQAVPSSLTAGTTAEQQLPRTDINPKGANLPDVQNPDPLPQAASDLISSTISDSIGQASELVPFSEIGHSISPFNDAIPTQVSVTSAFSFSIKSLSNTGSIESAEANTSEGLSTTSHSGSTAVIAGILVPALIILAPFLYFYIKKWKEHKSLAEEAWKEKNVANSVTPNPLYPDDTHDDIKSSAPVQMYKVGSESVYTYGQATEHSASTLPSGRDHATSFEQTRTHLMAETLVSTQYPGLSSIVNPYPTHNRSPVSDFFSDNDVEVRDRNRTSGAYTRSRLSSAGSSIYTRSS